MTIRSIAGLIGLNVFVLLVGCSVLWGLRGWRWWTELLRLGGVAYLLGIASLFGVFSAALVVGVPFRLATILASGAALVGGGLLLGRWMGRPLPALRPRGWRFPSPSLFSALFIAAIALYFEALFRWGRLQGPGTDWDAWRVWTLRAKGIYYSGHIEETLPTLGAYPTYPPGLSSLQAAAFHAMGSVDVVTLHLVNWFLALGFVAALAGLLAPRVRPIILLPFLVALLVMPRALPEWGIWLMADLPLSYLFSAAAVLLVLWLGDRKTWRLAATSVLLAGVILTKREGLVLAAVLVAAALVATSRDARKAWLPLAGSGIAAVILAAPWRIWVNTHGLQSDAVPGGYSGSIHDLDRAWPSFKLVVATLFADEFWMIVPALGLTAAALALLAGSRKEPIFLLCFTSASVVASTVVIWWTGFEVTQQAGVNPVGRLVMHTVFVVASVTPLLLEQAWTAAARGQPFLASRLPKVPAVLGWSVILCAVLGYPASMLLGTSALALPGGPPQFPGSENCVHPLSFGTKVRLVLGSEESYPRAAALRDRAIAAGFQDAASGNDGCGRVRVSVEGIGSGAAARELLARAVHRGFRASLENGQALLTASPYETPATVRARRLPGGSCHEAAGKRLFGGRPMLHLRRIGRTPGDGWAIEGLGWITERELTLVNSGARLLPAPRGPGFTARSLSTC